MPNLKFGDYLRQRRSMVPPTAIGLPEPGGRRRVPGLRREEVARRVAVSVDYYTRLEQGRVGRPSDSVLEAIASALLLGPAERAHLDDLANNSAPGRRTPSKAGAHQPVRPELRSLIDRLPMPAMVMTETTRVLHWNSLAAALFGGPATIANDAVYCARLVFLDPITAARHSEWEDAARDTVGMLRLAAGRRPGDRELKALLDDLAASSAPFRALWENAHVYEKTHGAKTFRHPLIGDVLTDFETFQSPDRVDVLLVTYQPHAAADEDALAILGASLATQRIPVSDRE